MVEQEQIHTKLSNSNEQKGHGKIKLKELHVDLPVQYKSVDFFRVIDVIRGSIKSGENELGRNNIKNALQYLEHSLYYMKNINY